MRLARWLKALRIGLRSLADAEVCWVVGHDPVKRFELVPPRVDEYQGTYREWMECRRCEREL